jgi:hypothetical protein
LSEVDCDFKAMDRFLRMELHDALVCIVVAFKLCCEIISLSLSVCAFYVCGIKVSANLFM